MANVSHKAPRSIWPAVAAIGGALLIAAVVNRSSERSATPPKAPRAAAANQEITRYQVPVTSSQPSKGPADAPVTIVEWCDFHLQACKDAEGALATVLSRYGDRVRWVYRHFSQPQSQEAHEFARIAFEQAGKFWEAKQLLQDAPTAHPSRADFERYAGQLGLDWPRVSAALDKHTHTGHVIADRMFATMFEASSAPAFFVNGRRLEGAPTPPAFTALIDDELARAQALVASGVPKEQVYAELTKNGVWKRVSARPN
jgi:protein-disulfide isomerase